MAAPIHKKNINSSEQEKLENPSYIDYDDPTPICFIPSLGKWCNAKEVKDVYDNTPDNMKMDLS